MLSQVLLQRLVCNELQQKVTDQSSVINEANISYFRTFAGYCILTGS